MWRHPGEAGLKTRLYVQAVETCVYVQAGLKTRLYVQAV